MVKLFGVTLCEVSGVKMIFSCSSSHHSCVRAWTIVRVCAFGHVVHVCLFLREPAGSRVVFLLVL